MVLSVCPVLAHELVVTIDNIKEASEIHTAIYYNTAAFEAHRDETGGAAPSIADGTIKWIESRTLIYRHDVAPETCTIGIFHDANLNNRLDKYFFSAPCEQYDFSNGARGFMIRINLTMRHLK